MLEPKNYQYLGWGITQIETGYIRPGLAACYLLEQGDTAVLIETGTVHTVDTILALLSERGIAKEQLSYVIATHVHLDHAGGVGALMQALPKAKLVVHPRGARHMIDPGKLRAGAMAVYGEDTFRKLYGELVPVDEERVIEAGDGFELSVDGRPLRFLDTPGHARHHLCVYDKRSDGIFSGDTFGIAYREFENANGPFIFPTSTPVQFDPEMLKDSIRRLMRLKPKRFFLTHYGQVEMPERLVESLLQQIDDYVEIAHSAVGIELREDYILDRLMDYSLERLQAHQCNLPEEICRTLLCQDMQLNAQGLDFWLTSVD